MARLFQREDHNRYRMEYGDPHRILDPPHVEEWETSGK